MYTYFYISDTDYESLKTYIRQSLSTARFRHNPEKHGSTWSMSLDLSVEDHIKLNLWLNDKEEEVKRGVHISSSWWERVKGFFNYKALL